MSSHLERCRPDRSFTRTASIPRYPSEDEKLRATSLTTRRGGNCGNSLEVLQQYVPDNFSLHFVTVLPSRESAATRKVLSSFNHGARPVDLSLSVYREDQTEAASCFVLHSQSTGSRTIVNHNGLDDMTIDEFVHVAAAFKNRDSQTWWHFEVRTQTTSSSSDCVWPMAMWQHLGEVNEDRCDN